ADGAYQPQRGEVVARRVLGAELDERADRRRGGVEDGDVVAGHHLPQPVGAGGDRGALVHHLRGAAGHGPVGDVAVPGDPADVGGAPVDVVLLEVEDVLARQRHVDLVAARRVQHALGPAGGARRVEDVGGVLGVHGHGGAAGGRLAHQVVVPLVAAALHVHGVLGAAHDDHVPHAGRARQGLVDGGLQLQHLPAAVAAVGGDDDRRLGVVEAVGQGA